MFPEINSIKRKRLISGLTQKELAKISNVSQSMIAKIESKKIEPSYSIVKKLFETLENFSKKDERTCEDIMNTKIFLIDSKKKVKDATKIIHKHNISRIPVINEKEFVGVVSENALLDRLALGTPYEELLEKRVSEIMDTPLPMVNMKFSVKNIIPLIKESGALLVLNKEKPAGIISKSDLI